MLVSNTAAMKYVTVSLEAESTELSALRWNCMSPGEELF